MDRTPSAQALRIHALLCLREFGAESVARVGLEELHFEYRPDHFHAGDDDVRGCRPAGELWFEFDFICPCMYIHHFCRCLASLGTS
jgi:hypothetical protein